ncbi:MAG: alanine racemase [Sandaracinaceae bacterium]
MPLVSTQIRPTRAEIDLAALAHNLRVVRARAGEVPVYAVVKADAYGHGLLPVAHRLAAEGVDGFCVALAEEGLRLRAAGINAPIIVLNGIYDGAHRRVLEAGLTPVVYDLDDVERFSVEARGRPHGVHLKVDTGMTRLGVRPDALAAILDRLEQTPLRVAGLMTHFSSAEDDAEATDAQLSVFREAVALVRARGHTPRLHAANSGAVFERPDAHADLVRAGVALYGIRSSASPELDLRPVMRLVTSVARVVDVPEGTAVGYGRTWTAARPSRIATLAIGYGDGLMRHLSNRGHALLSGTRCPLVGRISMDLTGVDVTGVACARGDEAVLWGHQAGALLHPEEVAARAGTIAYEVLASVSPRVPRVAING